MWALLFLVAVVWALVQAGLLQRDLVNEGGWTVATRIVDASVHPDLSPEFLRLTLDAAITTLAFAVCGTFLSMVFGVVVGILASEVWWESLLPTRGKLAQRLRGHRGPWLVVRATLAPFRAIHEIIWGLLFVAIIGLDPLTAILAIAIPFGAVIAKVFLGDIGRNPARAAICRAKQRRPPA
jgi:phosphonate transport system permease protein